MRSLKNLSLAAAALSMLLVTSSIVAPRLGFGQGGSGKVQSVEVVNTVFVRDAPKVPFDALVTPTFSDGNNVASALLTTVPAGKQFVVTYASASAHLSVATHASFRILKSSSLGTVAVYELKPVSTETIAGIVASEPLHIFVNAGESLTAIVARDSLTGTGPVFVTVSGYLVDNP